jgi:hypothetical protein
MRDTLLKDRQYLRKRHRLSHQQIDTWLGENRSTEFINDKLKQLELVRQFLHITDKLGNKGVPFISIKGPLLSLRLYGDPTVRISHDIDLLIDKNDLDKTIALMLNEGFVFAHNFEWPSEKHRQELIVQNMHHIGFYSKKLDLIVEVHWVLSSKLPVPVKTLEKIVADNLTSITYAGRNFTVLNNEFELLYLLIHGGRHGWSRLKWLVDIHEYTKQEIDEMLFNKLVEQFRVNRIVVQTNYLLEKYFNNRLPTAGKKKIPNRLLLFAEQNIEKEEINLNHSISYLINNYRYSWLLFTGFHYKLNCFSGMNVRIGDVYNVRFASKAAYYFYRPYSFLKRRIFNV